MKRNLVFALATFLLLTGFTPLFAKDTPLGLSGAGVYGSLGSTSGALGGGVGVALKWGAFPVVGLQYNLLQSRINASADYYVVDAKGISTQLSYFLGAGAYAGLGLKGGSSAFDIGLRIPVGLQFWPVKGLELFAAPVLSVPLIPAPAVGFGAEFGLRVRL